MAGLIYEVNIPSTSLSAGTAQVVAFLEPATSQRVKLKAYGFFFDGTTNSATPVQIQLYRQSTANSGTLTSSVSTLPAQLTEPGLPESPRSTYGTGASVQPTVGNVYKTITVHPQLGYEYIAPLGEEEQISPGSTTPNWIVSATAQATVNIRGYFRVEE